MPVMRCQRNGREGHKWGRSGYCYTGANSRERALTQGRAIEASKRR